MKYQYPTLSIVIPALNEEGFINNLLDDIVLQDGYSEIIVADSGSRDKTKDIVKRFAKNHPNINIQLTHASKKGVALARNQGASLAKGEYIFFLDSDVRISKHFFKNTLREMIARDLDAGMCYMESDSKKLFDRTAFYLNNNTVLKLSQYTKRPLVAGAALIVKTKTHHEVKGFNTKLSYAEDHDYIQKIVRQKKTFRILNSEKVVFSTRRFNAEGRGKLLTKFAVISFCYLFNIKKEVEYEFGKFSKGNK